MSRVGFLRRAPTAWNYVLGGHITRFAICWRFPPEESRRFPTVVSKRRSRSFFITYYRGYGPGLGRVMFYMVMDPLSIAMARNNGNVSWWHLHAGEDLVKADGEYCFVILRSCVSQSVF